MNKFAIVGISGLLISAVCLSAAATIGGKALYNSGFDFGGFDRPRCDFDASGKSASRSIDWSGGDSASIELPANAHYRRASGTQLLVTGDSAVLPHVRVRNGKIGLDCRGADYGSGLEITLPGRLFRKFAMAGAGSLTLDDIDQPDLKIEMAGHGDVTANGKTGKLALSMAGANDAKLGGLTADNASLELAGSNDAEVAATDNLKVEIAGRGEVKLRTEPQHLKTEIAGSGHIIHPNDM
jgi:Putative auto-transporter adhesin, head GIN domain